MEEGAYASAMKNLTVVIAPPAEAEQLLTPEPELPAARHARPPSKQSPGNRPHGARHGQAITAPRTVSAEGRVWVQFSLRRAVRRGTNYRDLAAAAL